MELEENFKDPEKDKQKEIAQIEQYIKKNVDFDFSNGGLLYSDVINFWVESITYSTPPKPIPHYIQSYEKSEKDINDIREKMGAKEAAYYEIYYPARLKRIIELSDPEQIKKYDKLVDEFDTDLERIKEENDAESLQKFYARAQEIVDEKKRKTSD